MIRRPPRTTRTDTLFPYTTLFRSARVSEQGERSGRIARSHHVHAHGHQHQPLLGALAEPFDDALTPREPAAGLSEGVAIDVHEPQPERRAGGAMRVDRLGPRLGGQRHGPLGRLIMPYEVAGHPEPVKSRRHNALVAGPAHEPADLSETTDGAGT